MPKYENYIPELGHEQPIVPSQPMGDPIMDGQTNMPGVQPPSTSSNDPAFDAPGPTATGGHNWTNPNFTPTMPQPELMSLDEMIDIINRRTELATQPRLDALDREREMMQYEGQRRIGDVRSAYEGARQDLISDTNRSQQQMSQMSQARGIYDSGLAMKLGSQIARKGMELGVNLGEEQARQLADIAEFIHLSQKHNMDEIKSIMGEKAMMASTMLDEMRLEQQQRGDMLAQQEFENWLAHQAFQLNEYWRQQEFDASRADQEWRQWFDEESMRLQSEHMEWERIFNMNKFEAEHELQRMMANHQISQSEFQNALALDEFNLKKWLYQAQNRQPTTRTVYQPAPAPTQPGAWWDLSGHFK